MTNIFIDRMPTVSAAQALQHLKSSPTRCISSGLSLLDCALQNQQLDVSDDETVHAGVSRGRVTEIYGPPGVGKTALGMQLAANVLHADEGVIWVGQLFPSSLTPKYIWCAAQLWYSLTCAYFVFTSCLDVEHPLSALY